jgi:hypothetical protein
MAGLTVLASFGEKRAVPAFARLGVALGQDKSLPEFSLAKDGEGGLRARAGRLDIRNDKGALVTLAAESLELKEAGTTRAVLGRTEVANTKTGVISKRPISSLVLLEKNGKVLWRAS